LHSRTLHSRGRRRFSRMMLLVLLLLSERRNRRQSQDESQWGTKFSWTHAAALSNLKYLYPMPPAG